MPFKPPNSWSGYILQQRNQKFDPDFFKSLDVDTLLNANAFAHNVLNHSVPMVYLLDYTTGDYRFISNHGRSHLNISFEKMKEGGIDFIVDRYHPSDLKLFSEEVFPDRVALINNIPAEDRQDLIFSFNYRLRGDDGKYVNLLQRNAYIQSDEDGRPLLSMGVVTNVNYFKESDPVMQVVEQVDSNSGRVALLQKNTYYLREEDKVFSGRERQVLQLIANGLTSKQIADKLYISEHTVINHKRNMHHKSNTQNTAGLVGFAFREKLM